MHLRAFARLSTLVAAVALAGCGGGGDSGPGTTTITLAASSAGTLHGNGGPNGASGIRVGQLQSESLRGGFRFPLLPFVDSGDTIVSATLRARQTAVTGAPYATHGVIVVDLVDFGVSLGGDDHDATVLAAAVGTLSSDTTLGFKEVDVTAQVAAAAAADDFTLDFIARFNALAPVGSADLAQFADHLAGAADAPQLVIIYR